MPVEFNGLILRIVKCFTLGNFNIALESLPIPSAWRVEVIPYLSDMEGPGSWLVMLAI